MTEATRPWTVKRALAIEAGRLRGSSQSPRLDVEVLLAHVLGVTRERLYAESERVLGAAEHALLHELVARRARHEPVAYLIGRKAFHEIEVGVDEHTLIPRPETETLVEVALEKLREMASPLPVEAPAGVVVRSRRAPRLLDIGTGSGAVALAIVHAHPTVEVVASDVDYRALEIARMNAARLGLSDRVEFAVSDLFDELPPGALFDVIVSNPPYVADGELPQTPPDVRSYEPHGALLGGADGLDVYRRLVPGTPPVLRPHGWLAVEIAETRAAEVVAIFEGCRRFGPIEVHNDLGGRPRVVAGRELE